jgi:hypothetical protein
MGEVIRKETDLASNPYNRTTNFSGIITPKVTISLFAIFVSVTRLSGETG